SVTRDKLIVDEEKYEEAPSIAESKHDESESPLSPEEYKLLHCLLYGESTDWLREEGLLLSVLVDGINEKLFDTFNDSVMDDTPEIFEDYIEALKEIAPK
ncbi:MAG: hypothetical protein HDQ93_05955, partial [Desulfovibrio sp.]|nr:hypothetical protein [Desulfovibrio sp.]